MAFWGYNNDSSLRNTSSVSIQSNRRVLKPPGGGSSDIFGSESNEHVPRRNVRSHEASMGAVLQQNEDQPAAPTPSKARVDSHSRLFGPAPEGQMTPSKNRMKSNIPIGERQMNGHNKTSENGHANGDTTDGNPVTGNGYSENGINGNGLNGHGNGLNGHGNGMMNGHGMNGSGNGHRRVPPGGFSSGLW